MPFIKWLPGNNINIWQVNYNDKKLKFEVDLLLPHGSLILVTDQVFKYRPDVVIPILEDLVKRNVNNPRNPGRGFWKLAGRPLLREWLADVIKDYGRKTSEQKDRYVY